MLVERFISIKEYDLNLYIRTKIYSNVPCIIYNISSLQVFTEFNCKLLVFITRNVQQVTIRLPLLHFLNYLRSDQSYFPKIKYGLYYSHD